eukprot:CAMPEP_0173259520 /NCGR_PEP_ID=MMETSP1142-20121109/25041_1 /TAXON_ID=483371 /ORGANISM="non described non described, Strain CCMP2298" /LENGTH=45 /DNA_ID= /DNA_START= /DNA_END= /DNA_ORIENTATION=
MGGGGGTLERMLAIRSSFEAALRARVVVLLRAAAAAGAGTGLAGR